MGNSQKHIGQIFEHIWLRPRWDQRKDHMYEKVPTTLPQLIWFLQRCHHQGTMTEKRSEGTLIKCIKSNKTREKNKYPKGSSCCTPLLHNVYICTYLLTLWYSNWSDYTRKQTYWRQKLTLQKVERFMWMKISCDLGKMDTIDLVIQKVGWLLWSVRWNYSACCSSYAWGIMLQ